MKLPVDYKLQLDFAFEGHRYQLTAADGTWELEGGPRLSVLKKCMTVLTQTDDLTHALRQFLENFSESNLKRAIELADHYEKIGEQFD